jgi:hypothetical protein
MAGHVATCYPDLRSTHSPQPGPLRLRLPGTQPLLLPGTRPLLQPGPSTLLLLLGTRTRPLPGMAMDDGLNLDDAWKTRTDHGGPRLARVTTACFPQLTSRPWFRTISACLRTIRACL